MTWLARVILTKDDLESCRLIDTYKWHKAVWQCFPDFQGGDRPFLLRFNQRDEGAQTYILSDVEPVRPDWCPVRGWAIKEISAGFLEHARYRFDLLANVTKKLIVRDASGARRKNGIRVPLIHEEDQRNWLCAKGLQHGFLLDESVAISIDPAGRYPFRRAGKYGLHVGVRFRGVLNVTNKDLFSMAFYKGIGSAKAFGFGMLLLQPIL